MRICMLMVKHPPERKSPIMPEVIRLLGERGAEVEVLYPDEELPDLAALRPAHDLYVLKSGTELALSLAGALHAQGGAILNPYPAASALRDKAISTRILQAAGVPVPESFVVSAPERLAPLLEGGPIITKPNRGSQGRGIQVVRDAAALASIPRDGGLVFAQRWHRPDGPDLKIYGVGGRFFGVHRVWPPRTYEDKLGRPFAVDRELEDVARRCGEAFGVDVFGVDVIRSGGRPWVVDMQCFPGFKGVPDAARLLADAIHGAALRATGSGRPRGAAVPVPSGDARPLDRELRVATQLALRAGAILREHRVGPLTVSEKAGGEPVTAADLASNAIIRDGLAAAFPGDALFSEETQDSPERLSAERVWIVDPLDATSDYVANGDEWCVSIGLAIGGRPTLGVVYNPTRGELVAGYRGGGVTVNGAPAAVRDPGALEGARLEVSRKEWRRGLAERVHGLPVEPAASMAYKLARVAAGLSDGAFSIAPRKEWGTCAGIALVLAAGGEATLLDGSEIACNRAELRQRMGMVAAGPRLRPLVVEALRARGLLEPGRATATASATPTATANATSTATSTATPTAT
ncbi:MAG TPA: inositol monophosphatase family protein [Anaeromyxobacter sp.]|nr:inositol monophosphatase family protein [Anaeromyxobacter sp.]